MKKLYVVVNVELVGKGVVLCMTDHQPDTEQVDPRKDRIAKVKAQLDQVGAGGLGEVLESISELPEVMGAGMDQVLPHRHRETAKAVFTFKEYEAIGKPTVGDLVDAMFSLGKPPADPAGGKP